ncbi:MAG: hypothetical protein H0T73_07075 [Ardenticatenales bacterium]|nr:hypothetical protein [Ardenticatenales bacterium]
MVSIKVRLWGEAEEVKEASQRLGTVMSVVDESVLFAGRRGGSEVWQSVTVDLPVQAPENEMLSVFARLLCREHTTPEAWEHIFQNLAMSPGVQTFLQMLASTRAGRIMLQEQRAAWALKGEEPPWEPVLGPIDLESL